MPERAVCIQAVFYSKTDRCAIGREKVNPLTFYRTPFGNYCQLYKDASLVI